MRKGNENEQYFQLSKSTNNNVFTPETYTLMHDGHSQDDSVSQ